MRDPPRTSRPAALVAAAALATLAGLVLGGCLTYETAEYHVRADSTQVVHAAITLRHLESDASTSAGRRADFAQLAKDATGDEALIRAARGNTYLRHRRLWLERGVLCASYELLCLDVRAIDTTSFQLVFAAKPPPPPATSAAAAADTSDPFANLPSIEAQPESVVVALRCRVARGDSVLATNASVAAAEDGTLTLTWPDSTGDKWVELRNKQFHARPAFAALYRAWLRDRGQPPAVRHSPGRAGAGRAP